MRAHPEIGTASTHGAAIRQMRVRKFPYKVVYRNQQDGIEVIAVAHGKRRPGYWKGRR
jgi:plasmid stabilization system protein ParE